MVNVNDCGCPCEDNGKKKQIEERALSSINKIYTTEGATYFPDGTGMVTLPIPTTEQMQAIASVPDMASDIRQLKISDAEHTEAIATIESNVDTHARAIKVLQTEQTEQGQTVDALTKELPTDITLYKAGTGKIQAQVEQEDGTTLDSNVLDMAIPYQWDLISGTTNRSFRLKIHFSDGTTQETDDYVIPAGGGTDVSITDIRLETSGADKNQLKVTVDLDDGTPIGSSTISMVDSVTGSFSGGMLKVKVNGLESPGIAIDTGSLNAGTGIKIASGTISIDDAVVALKSDISDMETKTHANATFATKTALTALQNATKVAVSEFAITESADKVTITTTAIDGATSKSEDLPLASESSAGIITAQLYTEIQKLLRPSIAFFKAGSVSGTYPGTLMGENAIYVSQVVDGTENPIGSISGDGSGGSTEPLSRGGSWTITPSNTDIKLSFYQNSLYAEPKATIKFTSTDSSAPKISDAVLVNDNTTSVTVPYSNSVHTYNMTVIYG